MNYTYYNSLITYFLNVLAQESWESIARGSSPNKHVRLTHSYISFEIAWNTSISLSSQLRSQFGQLNLKARKFSFVQYIQTVHSSFLHAITWSSMANLHTAHTFSPGSSDDSRPNLVLGTFSSELLGFIGAACSSSTVV